MKINTSYIAPIQVERVKEVISTLLPLFTLYDPLSTIVTIAEVGNHAYSSVNEAKTWYSLAQSVVCVANLALHLADPTTAFAISSGKSACDNLISSFGHIRKYEVAEAAKSIFLAVGDSLMTFTLLVESPKIKLISLVFQTVIKLCRAQSLIFEQKLYLEATVKLILGGYNTYRIQKLYKRITINVLQ